MDLVLIYSKNDLRKIFINKKSNNEFRKNSLQYTGTKIFL